MKVNTSTLSYWRRQAALFAAKFAARFGESADWGTRGKTKEQTT